MLDQHKGFFRTIVLEVQQSTKSSETRRQSHDEHFREKLQAKDKLSKANVDMMDKKIMTAVQGIEEANALSIAEVNRLRDDVNTAGMDRQLSSVNALQEQFASVVPDVSAQGEKLTSFNRTIETGFDRVTSAAQEMATEIARRAAQKVVAAAAANGTAGAHCHAGAQFARRSFLGQFGRACAGSVIGGIGGQRSGTERHDIGSPHVENNPFGCDVGHCGIYI